MTEKKSLGLVKVVGILVILLFLSVILLKGCSNNHSSKNTIAKNHNTTNITDNSVSATTHPDQDEQMRFLATKIEENNKKLNEVIKDNKNLQGVDKQKNEALAEDLQQKIKALTESVEELKRHTNASFDRGTSLESGSDSTNQMIGTVEDMTQPVSIPQKVTNDNFNREASTDLKTPTPTSIPYFTIPANSTLGDAVLQTYLLAEVPVNNTLLQPAFQFKAIVGRKDLMASNGIELPADLNGIVFSGYSVGNMALSCARGYVTSMLFTWEDGSFTVVGDQSAGATELNPSNALGYLSTEYGNPCIAGKYLTDAAQVMATLFAGESAIGFSQAMSQAQTSSSMSTAGQPMSVITGDAATYATGQALSQGTQNAMNWYTSRINGSFDVVYVPTTVTDPEGNSTLRKIIINITQTIPIDKPITGRKIDYAKSSRAALNHHLD